MPAGLNDPLIEKTRSGFKIAFIEFAVIFFAEEGVSLLRKNGQTLIDSLGIALLSAVILSFIQRE
ncbi:MAG TPA: hypothetical protein VGL89_08795 [Candidatus Koribacter sp.]|jgi:hypothetical protein